MKGLVATSFRLHGKKSEQVMSRDTVHLLFLTIQKVYMLFQLSTGLHSGVLQRL
jgi:hypothetical protein